MWLKNYLRSLTSTSTRRPPIRRRPLGWWTRFDALEDRCMPSAYSIVRIPFAPQDVNNNGQVGGGASLWHDGTLIDLGVGGANAINDAGQVVGRSGNAAFLITPEDTDGDGAPDRWYRDDNQDQVNDLMTVLPFLAAYDINSSGQVVGDKYGPQDHAVLWQNGQLIDLGPGVAYGINDAGQVVGADYYSSLFNFLVSPEDTNGDGTPDLWYRDTNSDGVNDLMATLGQWGTLFNHDSAINAGGQVVGLDGYFSFVWTPSEPNGSSGTMEYLGPSDLNGGDFDTSDINASGRVVGNKWWSTSGEGGGSAGSVGMLWENGDFYDLADLLPADSGLSYLSYAKAINDSGWIAGDALTDSGTDFSFVMIPTGERLPQYVRIGDAAVSEGHSGMVSATFTVTMAKPSSQTVTVSYGTADSGGYYTASAGSDYQAASGTLTFAPGETTKTITIQVIGDRLGEQKETFYVNLNNLTGAIITGGQGTGTIADDEPRISIGDVTKREGRKNTTQFTFTVTLSAAYDQTVTMSFRTADGTATTSDTDYVARTGTLTFAPGETTKTITIEVKGDTKKEADETFYVDLFGLSSNALFTKSRGFGTILNDD